MLHCSADAMPCVVRQALLVSCDVQDSVEAWQTSLHDLAGRSWGRNNDRLLHHAEMRRVPALVTVACTPASINKPGKIQNSVCCLFGCPLKARGECHQECPVLAPRPQFFGCQTPRPGTGITLLATVLAASEPKLK